MPKAFLAIAVAGCLGVAACGGKTPPDTSAMPAQANCTGQRVAIVTNDWNESVEIYAVEPDANRPTLLGHLAPTERVEWALPPGVQTVKPVTARAIQPSYEPPAMKQLVRIRYICR